MRCCEGGTHLLITERENSMEHTEVGVIILTYNDWKNTLECLACVHAQSGLPRRIVVCDNGSDNEEADRILAGWTAMAARDGLP